MEGSFLELKGAVTVENGFAVPAIYILRDGGRNAAGKETMAKSPPFFFPLFQLNIYI
jgi:hypothetical protein